MFSVKVCHVKTFMIGLLSACLLTAVFLPMQSVQAVPEYCSQICTSLTACGTSCYDGFSTTCGEYGVCTNPTCSPTRTFLYYVYGAWGPEYHEYGNTYSEEPPWCYVYDLVRVCRDRDRDARYRDTYCDGSIAFTSAPAGTETQCGDWQVVRVHARFCWP